MIYFDNNKQAYGHEIENPICTISDELWKQYAGTDKWDIINGKFTDITETTEYQEQKAQEEIELIKGQLSELDSKAIRPLRAIMSGDYNTEDKETLNSIEEEAKRLREKILTLKNE